MHAGAVPTSSSDALRRVLAISGSTRAGSSNTALCRTAARCAPAGVEVVVFEGLATLPHFDPDDDHDPLPPAVADLRAAIEGAEAVLICTPEYAGTLPGSMKNLLEWTVGSTVMTGKATAWVNVSPDPHRGARALAALATVLGYVQADVITDACTHVPLARESIGADGLASEVATRAAITAVLTTLLAADGPDPA